MIIIIMIYLRLAGGLRGLFRNIRPRFRNIQPRFGNIRPRFGNIPGGSRSGPQASARILLYMYSNL